jgi:hypothetical protein
MTENYAASMTEGQRKAHERILALQKVYDAAVNVMKAHEVWQAVPDFDAAENLFDEAMIALEAVVWNTQFILGEKYPFLENNEKAEWEARRISDSRQVQALP